MSDYLDPNNEELLKDFFMEAQMQVDLLEQNILSLENNPGDKDAIDEIFRAAHTLKSGAATVQMTKLSEFTHIIEDVLDEIRSGTMKISGKVVDTLLSSIDIIKDMLEAKGEGKEYIKDYSHVIDVLIDFLPESSPALKKMTKRPKKKSVPEADFSSPSRGKSDVSEDEFREMKDAAARGTTVYKVVVSFNEDNPMNTVGGIQVYASLKSVGQILKTIPDFEQLYEDTFYPDVEYYVATELKKEFLTAKVSLQDVTTGMQITNLDEERLQEEKGSVSKPTIPKVLERKNVTKKTVPEVVKETTDAINSEINDNQASVSKSPDSEKSTAETKENSLKNMKKSRGSILRVDSKRIDNLLNLVSETVINKATFNQISSQFSDNMTVFQNEENSYKEKLKEILEGLPQYLTEIQNGKSIKELKKEINSKYSDLFTVFDEVENSMKVTINKFKTTAQNLGRTIGDLHEGVLRIRMVPISQIFSRFPRLVRDLSKTLKKDIQLDIEGEDTELDKSVIEDLLDPLIHCVRNSLDHGIETPQVREAAGKPSTGHILLKASNEGNIIRIEVSDDGAGIDVEKVRKKAIDRGIIHPSKQLSDIEAYNLIFEPGFSTARDVTNISGRGVGLDVVKKQIEKLNGNVSVWSESGKGSRFTIKLPLTLAIIQGLLVKVGSETYAIPITSVIESHRIKPSEIKMIDNHEVFNVRDDVISLLRLNNLFRLPPEEEKEYCFIVVVGSGDKKMGLMVDSLIGEEDVVIKPLKDHYTNSPGIAGATILGDGTVSLIIDVSQLLELGMQKEMVARHKRQSIV